MSTKIWRAVGTLEIAPSYEEDPKWWTDDKVMVCFENDCTGQGSFRGKTWDLICKDSYPHGHVSISCEDGTMWIPFPIASQTGVQRLMGKFIGCGYIHGSEIESIVSLPELEALPVDIYGEELAILEDDVLFNGFKPGGWVS